MTRITVTGDLDFDGLADRARAGLQRGVALAAEDVLTLARQRVPHEEGMLEASGMTETEAHGDSAESIVAFNKVYAARQHEELTWHHDDGRQAKYLESALTDKVNTIPEVVAQAVKEAL